jgi:ABC-type multidrug transport system ATPase subunit
LIDADAGEILIDEKLVNKDNRFNVDLNKVGFMPQDSCLYQELTIRENFFYFGRLYRMTACVIRARVLFLMKLLDLPLKERLVDHLSGGQLRRASFAVSLINSPKLLMLDEPTVGMDPVLRKKIWSYLLELSIKEGTTIILTTHYIEEARKADFLGFIRRGKIIEENTPDFLMRKYNQNILEDVFYSICTHISDVDVPESHHQKSEEHKIIRINSIDSTNEITANNEPFLRNSKEQYNLVKASNSSFFKPIQNEMSISSSRLAANIYKDIIKSYRNKKILIVNLMVPIIQITLFCLCVGQAPQNLPIGYVNNDNYSFTIASSSVDIGQEIINEMDYRKVAKKRFDSFEDGYNQVLAGNLWALFVIDKNFTRDAYKIYEKYDRSKKLKFKNLIHIWMDNTNQQISYAIRDNFIQSVKGVSERYLNLVGMVQGVNNSYPIKFEEPVYGEREPVFTFFINTHLRDVRT